MQQDQTLVEEPDSSIHGISQGKTIWSGLPFPSPGDLPDPGIQLASPALAGRFFTAEPPRKPPLLSRVGVALGAGPSG